MKELTKLFFSIFGILLIIASVLGVVVTAFWKIIGLVVLVVELVKTGSILGAILAVLWSWLLLFGIVILGIIGTIVGAVIYGVATDTPITIKKKIGGKAF